MHLRNGKRLRVSATGQRVRRQGMRAPVEFVSLCAFCRRSALVSGGQPASNQPIITCNCTHFEYDKKFVISSER